MQAKRRIISIICLTLTFVMLLPLLFSCAKNKDGEETSGQETVETREYLDDLGEFDFDGYEFRALSITSEDGTYTKFDVEELTSVVLDNSIYNRNREIEERFNVKFVAEELTYPKCYEQLTRQCEAQTEDYDIIMLVNRHAYSAAISGYIYSVDKLPYLDITKDYYLHDINEMSSINGTMFLAYSEESLYTFQRATCLAYNKAMANNLGIEDLYATVNNGEWTFEKFLEYARNAKVVDSTTGEVDTYGLYGHGDYTFVTFLVAAGETFIEKKGNSLKFTAGSNEKMDEIANTEITLIKEGTMGYSYDYKNANVYNDIFIDGKALFHGTVVGKLLLLKDIEGWDYGVLPWPKYDTEQTEYSSRVVDAWIHVVPSSNTNPERTSVILEALASGSAKWVFPAYYENSIQGRTLRDADSIDMLEIIRATRVFDWGGVTWSESIRAPIEKKVFIEQTMSISRVCQSQMPIVNKLIKEAEDGVAKLLEGKN